VAPVVEHAENAASARANSTPYVLDDYYIPATPNGYVYKCTVAGTSAGSPPTFGTTVGGTTTEVYAPVTIGTDNAAGTSILLEPNDTNDAVKISCTGITSEIWRWVASVDAVEVAYGT
jgi:hypothetical protein